jgi:hypothetical protein
MAVSFFLFSLIGKQCPVRVDAVEKVRGATPKRNNRIEPNNVLNLCCEYGSSLESMLRGKDPQNPFSTASVKSGNARPEYLTSAFHPIADLIADIMGGPLGAITRHPMANC